ncbi:MAG: DsrE family protein [Myxococcales bacterium]|nr:DsrE family protein [Myxococcales bacterium]
MRMVDEDGLALVVVSGPGASERAVFGLASALAAAVSGVDVQVILSAEGTYWCAPGSGEGVEVPDFPTIEELLEELHLLGISVDACAESIARYCGGGDGGEPRVRPWIHRVERGALIERVHHLRAVIC